MILQRCIVKGMQVDPEFHYPVAETVFVEVLEYPLLEGAEEKDFAVQ